MGILGQAFQSIFQSVPWLATLMPVASAWTVWMETAWVASISICLPSKDTVAFLGGCE